MSPQIQHLLMWLIPLAPLTAAVVTACIGPQGLKEKSHVPTWIGLAVATVCAYALLFSIVPSGFGEHESTAVVATGYEWVSVGSDFKIGMDLRADAMTAIMLSMVTLVSFLVSVFAAGYMHHDPGYPRFFACFSLFVFSMCMLVLSSSFLMLFVFWEGVGLCSYLLIGFWYQKPVAAAAAKKAFVVNRIGDFGFLIGIFLIWRTFGGLDFDKVLDADQLAKLATNSPGTITAICLLLLLGAMGKSAQFPLHVWLPDAMEGPTPVSALIHAATMVTAGVYVIARCTPMYIHSPTAQVIVSCVGGLTALIAALIALTQFDLKRVLAYSTVSQLGYMFMALGAGAAAAAGSEEAGKEVASLATTAGMFHLYTHAFFKALLFLAAGSVMHSMGDVIDMRRFSGLKKALPITHWTFLCGAAALAGVPLLSGFWSKDEILAVLHHASQRGPHAGWYFAVYASATFTAFLTAFYTFRAYFKTFWGPEKFPEEAGHHPHDAPPVMAWPLRILAVCALLVGIIEGPTGWFAHYIQHAGGLEQAHEPLEFGLMAISVFAVVAGIGLAWVFYVLSPALPGKVASAFGPLYYASLNKFYFDEIFWGILVAPLRGLAILASWFDRGIIDSIVDGLAHVPKMFSWFVVWFQSGRVPGYALLMWIGLLVCILFAMHLLPAFAG